MHIVYEMYCIQKNRVRQRFVNLFLFSLKMKAVPTKQFRRVIEIT